MLSEAYEAAKSLERAGIVPEATSGDVKIPGVSSGVRAFVRLNPEGDITSLRVVEPDDEAGLWTIMEGNHNSFPVVRLKRPLVALPSEHAIWPALAQAVRSKNPDPALSAALLAHVDPEAAEVPDDKLWLRLRDVKAPVVQARAGEAIADVAELCTRFIRATPDPEIFFRHLARAVLSELRLGKDDLARYARELLVGKEPNRGKAEASVQLAFDLDGSITIYRKDQRIAMSAARDRRPLATAISHCAYSGGCQDPQDEAFPKIRVPVLGFDYPLLSMFSDAGCNVRYGLTDEQVLPISATVVQSAHRALSHLLGPENENKVWRAIASGQLERKSGKTFDKRDLLVAYVATGAAPVNPSLLIGIPAKHDYAAETEPILRALQGIASKSPSSRLNVFVLRAVTKGQAQAVYAERPLVSEVFVGAEAWQRGQQNRPQTILDSRTKPSRMTSPEEAVRILSYVWKQSGTDAHRKTGISLGQALDLLLRRSGRDDDAAKEMLALIITRGTPLLRSVGTELRQHLPPGPVRSYIYIAQRLVNLIALCLHHFNVSQDQIMKEPAYLIGRLLALADTLHIQYCVAVRGGALPPTLIGNALLGTALDSPVSALATLADRLRIYIGWAETATFSQDESKVKAIRIAGWTLKQFANVEAQLNGQVPEGRSTDLMKAQMLLGYIARTKNDADVPEVEPQEEEIQDAQ